MFYSAVIGFIAGIILRHHIDLGLSFLLVFVFLVPTCLFVRLFGPDSVSRSLLTLVIILFLLLGYTRLHVSLSNIDDFNLGYETFTGTIVDEPDSRENSTHYIVSLNELDVKARITLGQYPILNYGDVIELNGKFEKPKNFKNEKNGIEFDYVNFLLKDDIQYVSYFPKITILRDPRQSGDDGNVAKGSLFKKKLFGFKSWFVNNLNKSLASPHSSLAAGILIGAKQSLGEQLLEDFRKVGLIHIVVLSGYNVTIIIDAIQKVLSFLPRTFSFFLSILSIISFAIFTGASATTIRASIMATLVVISRYNSRTYGVNRALFLAGFLMILHNPRILMSDPGFQLSFVATLGLLHISPKIETLLEKIRITDKFEIRQIIATTISTQLAVLPLLINMTGEISAVALVANLLVLPVIPISMAFSAISGLTNWLGIIALPINLITYWLLEYSLFITKWLASFSFATIDISF